MSFCLSDGHRWPPTWDVVNDTSVPSFCPPVWSSLCSRVFWLSLPRFQCREDSAPLRHLGQLNPSPDFFCWIHTDAPSERPSALQMLRVSWTSWRRRIQSEPKQTLVLTRTVKHSENLKPPVCLFSEKWRKWVWKCGFIICTRRQIL